MNCRPGDLAVVIKNQHGQQGALVNVDAAYKQAGWWVCTPLSRIRTWDQPIHSGRVCIHDDALRPLRDPGDDATDETLIYAGLPAEKTKERV
jgi:hypothetical protein